MDAKYKIDKLEEYLRKLDDYYYNKNISLVTDEVYDSLLDKLNKLREMNGIPHISHVGAPSDNGRVKHLKKMYSISNTYTSEDTVSFLEEINYTPIVLQEKIDGLAINLTYIEGTLTQATTRGDGYLGEDVTEAVYTIPTVAKKLSVPLDIELRGEIFLTKEVYDHLVEDGYSYSNLRNASSGMLRTHDVSLLKTYPLSIQIYGYGFVNMGLPDRYSEMMSYIEEISSMPMVKSQVLENYTFEEVEVYYNQLSTKRCDLPYDIDGLVIKVDKLSLQDTMGYTDRYPKYVKAWKFKAKGAVTTLLDIVHQVGRTGVVTPVGHIEPTKIDGVTISTVTLHNPAWVKEKDLRIGDKLTIIRSGDVIPKVDKILYELRTGDEKPYTPPTSCHRCDNDVIPTSNKKYICIGGLNCPEQSIAKLVHFVSRDALDIEHIGQSTIEALYNIGVDTYSKLLHVSNKELTEIGLGPKEIENVLESIGRVYNKDIHADKFIYSLGIPLVGKKTSKTLATVIGSIEGLMSVDKEQLSVLGNQTIKIKSILNYISSPLMQSELTLLSQIINLTPLTESKYTIAVTGKIPDYTAKDIEKLIQSKGHEYTRSVTKDVDYVLVGDKPSSSKLSKIQKYNIPTIDIETLKESLK